MVSNKKLVEWLSQFPAVSDVREISVSIKGTTYNGASYRDSNFGDKPRLYLLGALPACYRRSSRTAFVIGGNDWYVACYMEARRIEENPSFAPFHPCGEHFMLCRWEVPDGSAIDRFELRPYNRVPVLASFPGP
jgi:hypothetical protein